MDKGRRPGRLRHSWEARCRLVWVDAFGASPQAAATACGMSRATAYRLLRRYQEGGWEALRDRPPIAKHHPHRLSPRRRRRSLSCGGILGGGHGRCQRLWAGRPRRSGGCLCAMAARGRREPRPPANRYEYAAPGELVHLDIKKLGRFWHVGKRVLQDGVRRSGGAGWHTRMSLWMTTPATRSCSCADPRPVTTASPS